MNSICLIAYLSSCWGAVAFPGEVVVCAPTFRQALAEVRAARCERVELVGVKWQDTCMDLERAW